MLNRVRLYASAIRAMLGAITPNIRQISCSLNEDSFEFCVHVASFVLEEEKEIARVICSEIIADFPEIISADEKVEISDLPFSEINNLEVLLFRRFE